MTTTPTTQRRSMSDRLLVVVEIPAVLVIMAMMLHVVANAVLRTFADAPIEGTLEVTQFYYLPAIVLLGIVAAQARGEHIVADMLFEGFPALARRVMTVLVDLVVAGVAGLFAWYGWVEAEHSHEIGKTLGNTEMQLWPIQYFLVFIYVVFAVQLLASAVRTLLPGRAAQPDAGLTAPQESEIER